jgi:lambda family phage portal protein
MRQQLQAIAAGLGLPYEIGTGDLREVNDRVIRVVLNEFHRKIEQRQFSIFIPQICRPIRAAWLDAAYLAGAIALPNYGDRRREYLRTRWVPQGWSYIHPVQEVEAQALQVKHGFTSRSEIVLRQGYDAELIDAENAADHERERRLGLDYSEGGGGTLLIEEEEAD